MSLTVGHIAYLNCVPFFHYLRASGFDGRIVDGVPAELNRLLAQGEVDLSPSSSFEYGRNAAAYTLLPHYSISAHGPVKSVLLFTPRSLADLAAAPIELTEESATSVNLLTVLLREYLGAPQATLRPAAAPVEDLAAQGASVLAIGDRALRLARQLAGTTNIYDLGALWRQHTGLPFVFALWIVRRQAALAQPDALRRLEAQLGTALHRAQADLPALAQQTASAGCDWIPEDALVDYWRSVSYELTPQHLAGLQLFFRLCVKHGLLAREPQLTFFR